MSQCPSVVNSRKVDCKHLDRYGEVALLPMPSGRCERQTPLVFSVYPSLAPSSVWLAEKQASWRLVSSSGALASIAAPAKLGGLRQRTPVVADPASLRYAQARMWS